MAGRKHNACRKFFRQKRTVTIDQWRATSICPKFQLSSRKRISAGNLVEGTRVCPKRSMRAGPEAPERPTLTFPVFWKLFYQGREEGVRGFARHDGVGEKRRTAHAHHVRMLQGLLRHHARRELRTTRRFSKCVRSFFDVTQLPGRSVTRMLLGFILLAVRAKFVYLCHQLIWYV